MDCLISILKGKNMIHNKLKYIIILVAFLAVSLFSSCKPVDEKPEPTATPTPETTQAEEVPYSEHLELTFMPRRASSSKAALSQDDLTIKYLEERYNVTFNIIDTSSEDDPKSYSDILTTLIVSGDIPDFMDLDVLNQNESEYKKLLQAGLALNVGSFMNENSSNYPMLDSLILSAKSTDKFKTDSDMLYCLPHYVAPDDTVYLVRGDWVKKAGYKLEDINTLEKFSELMNAFVENDFDGADTVGFSTSAEKYLYPIYAGYTGSYMFKDVDGHYTDWYTLYELRESLGYLHLMFESEAFDNEYLSHDGLVATDKITTGKAGCIATDISNLPLLNEELKENIPEGYLEPLPIGMKGPLGTTRFTDKSNASANIISVYFEDPARIFDMCEFIFTKEGKDIIAYGIVGGHYSINGDSIVPNYEIYDTEGWKYKADGTIESVQTYNELRNVITNFEIIKTPEYSEIATDWYNTLLNYEDVLTNPFEDNGFNNSKMYAEMNAVKDKWVDNFISGGKLLSDKNWEKFIKEYLEAGAQQQMDFYNNQNK